MFNCSKCQKRSSSMNAAATANYKSGIFLNNNSNNNNEYNNRNRNSKSNNNNNNNNSFKIIDSFSSKLNELSPEERSKAFYDIHGVADRIPLSEQESPEILQQKFSEMNEYLITIISQQQQPQQDQQQQQQNEKGNEQEEELDVASLFSMAGIIPAIFNNNNSNNTYTQINEINEQSDINFDIFNECDDGDDDDSSFSLPFPRLYNKNQQHQQKQNNTILINNRRNCRDQLAFLRAERYNPQNAINRWIRFLKLKYQLFGKESLSRDILSSKDLNSPQEQDALQSGVVQVLPQRDRAGRAVIVIHGKAHSKYEDTTLVIKVFFYLASIISLQDEETQQYGIIGIYYGLGQTKAYPGRSAALIQVIEAMPWNPLACHYCRDKFESAQSRILEPALRVAMSIMEHSFLCRFRFHIGTPMEVAYNLMTFGIPKEALPFRDDDDDDNSSLDLKEHHKILKTLQYIEQQQQDDDEDQFLRQQLQHDNDENQFFEQQKQQQDADEDEEHLLLQLDEDEYEQQKQQQQMEQQKQQPYNFGNFDGEADEENEDHYLHHHHQKQQEEQQDGIGIEQEQERPKMPQRTIENDDAHINNRYDKSTFTIETNPQTPYDINTAPAAANDDDNDNDHNFNYIENDNEPMKQQQLPWHPKQVKHTTTTTTTMPATITTTAVAATAVIMNTALATTTATTTTDDVIASNSSTDGTIPLNKMNSSKINNKNNNFNHNYTNNTNNSNSNSKKKKTKKTKPALILIPNPMDVIMGRGRNSKQRPGNLRLHHLLEKYKSQYDAISKYQKVHIAKKVYKEMKQANCRFLMPIQLENDNNSNINNITTTTNNETTNNVTTAYIQCKDSVVLEKIAHGFRNLRHRQQQQEGEGEVQKSKKRNAVSS